MKHTHLQEIAKFSAGVIACDMVVLVWLSMAHVPVSLFGRTVAADILLPAIVFDIALFIFLMHYGWNIGKIPELRERSYFFIAGGIFAVVSLAHLMRIITGVEFSVAEVSIPAWVSWMGIAVAAYFSYMSLHFAFLSKKKR